jgi:hypothetical protein
MTPIPQYIPEEMMLTVMERMRTVQAELTVDM